MDEEIGGWTGGSSWEEWAQDVGKLVIGQASAAHFVQPYELSKLKIQALGDAGYYTEGQRGAVAAGALPSGLLLIGAAVLAFVLIKG